MQNCDADTFEMPVTSSIPTNLECKKRLKDNFRAFKVIWKKKVYYFKQA